MKTLIGIHNAKQGLPWLVDLALVLALAWVVSGWMQRPALPSTAISKAASSKNVSIDIAALAATPLFGEEKKAAVPKPLPVVASTLNLKLVGTVVAGSDSAAIIKDAGNKQKVVMIGDVLQPGVVLKRISTDAIEVEHQGRLERIALPKRPLAHGTAAGRAGS